MYEIMVIDDDSTSLAIGRAILEPEYRVVLMKSGLQALGYLKRNPRPDLILLDMIMPGSSGMDTLKMIKNDQNLCEIPVLFLTSMEDADFQVESFTLGAVDILQKPVNPMLLKVKVARQLSFVSLQRENRLLRERLDQIRQLCAWEDPAPAP